ncbi:MAG: epoxyqueuosine reductase [Methanomassiliicoccaceae archaeon]|jgi:epoxyqueuosine reductase QueG|nr:epoxyqueuosine reductase [Methanomassiliicoccaceae archaeon]
MNDMMERIRATARSIGIVDIGVADADAWNTDAMVSKIILECERPSSLMQGARSVMVIGIPVQKTILATAPSPFYAEHYRQVNLMLDLAAQRMAMEIHGTGHAAIYVSRDGYQGISGLRKDPSSFFSHRHAAYLAGFGTFGLNNMLLTEKNGPRIRFTSVITTAELPSGKPMEKQLCTICMRCVDECPQGAVASSMYPKKITDKQKCVEYSAVLRSQGRSPCGRCIFVCTIGKDTNDPLPTDDAIANIRRFTK